MPVRSHRGRGRTQGCCIVAHAPINQASTASPAGVLRPADRRETRRSASLRTDRGRGRTRGCCNAIRALTPENTSLSPAGVFRRVLAVLLAATASIGAQESSDCLACHGKPDLTAERDGRQVSMYFDAERAAQSVHASADCIDCHVDLDGVTDTPHPERLAPADCGMCHDESFDSMAAYWGSTHGRGVTAGTANSPRCQDCHGSHDILGRKDPRSSAHLFNVPAMCTECHAEGAAIEPVHDLTRDQLIDRYKDRIHGSALFRQGLTVAPVCTTCHSAHAVLPAADPASLIHRDRVNLTCAQCHNDNAAVHRGIVAEALWTQAGAVPLCVDCHAPHAERRVAYGTNMSDPECLACHGQPEITDRSGRSTLLVDVAACQQSIHGRRLVACAQCHTGMTPSADERPCGNLPAKVNCATCHDAQVKQYRRGIHGSLNAEGEPNAPDCTDCHGDHAIMESRLPTSLDGVEPWLRDKVLASPTHRRNVPDLCAECHREGAPASLRNPEGESQKVEHYRMSIHGKGLLESGLIASANCVDCHSAHMELPPSDPDSTVAPEHLVGTCGKCHDGIHEQFRTSIHSQEGNPEFQPTTDGPTLPHCNECHSSHSVARTDLAEFKGQIVGQCGNCHPKITETYFDTYHGKVSSLGNDVVARCHDCHGSHRILGVSDPASTIHPDNVVATCAKCHPGSHKRFAGYLTHATHNDPERYPALYWSYIGMTALLVGVFSFFGLHLLAWLPRSMALRREHRRTAPAPAPAGTKEYVRFNRFNRNLHRTVIISFLGLALTGMILRFPDTGWARVLASLMGGTATAGWIHRLCAIATFGYMGMHLFDLVRRWRASGLRFAKYFFGPDSMIPTWRDVTEFVGTIKWFFGRGPRPHYGKWTYWEKFDYFAVFWGVVIIGTSGLILWFPELATRILPGWSINVATIIHSEEALLATGFIFTIHFFNAHLRPEKFPMDRVVFTGGMTIEELKADKPRLYEELVASGTLEQQLKDPPSPRSLRSAYTFGWVALTIGIVVVVMIVHGLLTEG